MEESKVEQNLNQLTEGVSELTSQVGTLTVNMNDLIEIVSYIKDNMASKADTATKEEMNAGFASIRAEMATKSDVKGVYSRLDFISQEIQDIKERLTALELRTKEDDEVIIQDIMGLRERVSLLENRIKVLESAKV